MIPAWILYQSFEAFHTAKALRDGQPPPDPLGLNEVGSWLNLGSRPRYPGQPGVGPVPGSAPGPAQPYPGYAPNPNPGYAPNPNPGYQPNFDPNQQGAWQTPLRSASTAPRRCATSSAARLHARPSRLLASGLFWKRKEPIGAVVLIGLGLIFLLDRLDIFNGRLMEFSWPVLLIGIGVWMIVSRLGNSQGGSK